MTSQELQKLEQIISDAYDNSGMSASKKNQVSAKSLSFFEHLINVEQGTEQEGEKTVELSEDLLFNGLLDKL